MFRDCWIPTFVGIVKMLADEVQETHYTIRKYLVILKEERSVTKWT